MSWSLLVRVAAFRRACESPSEAIGFWLNPDGQLEHGTADELRAQLIRHANGLFDIGPALMPEQHEFVRLYLPLLAASVDKPIVVAHLGQSIDARIATESGDSYYVTGQENLRHLHRMRALCDAIVVGAGTVLTDNPRLTTRLVEGPNPVRVVIDPSRRLSADRLVFNDQQALTIRVCAATALSPADSSSETEIKATSLDGEIALDEVLMSLRSRGLHAIFVEGGGITVSRWMSANLLDRLQIATAPLLVGPGRSALTLPPAVNMQACQRPDYRLYQMGEDILWDLDLRASAPIDQQKSSRVRRLA